MRTGTKLGAYGLVLAAALGAGAALGSVVGPIDVGDDAPAEHTEPAHGTTDTRSTTATTETSETQPTDPGDPAQESSGTTTTTSHPTDHADDGR